MTSYSSSGRAVDPELGTRPLARWAVLGPGCRPVFRLGLSTRGNTNLKAADIGYAVEHGVNYLNWCGYDDGLAQALRTGSVERNRLVLAMQLQSRDARSAHEELNKSLCMLATNRIDVVAFYYVESVREWEEICAPRGALEALREARTKGRVGLIGLTTHQRKLGARWAGSGNLDLIMIRYNAAHRGAEQDVFPVTDRLRLPVIAFTAQRWGALNARTAHDPPGFGLPSPQEWYRFVLANASVSVVLMAPNDRQELEENLKLLQDWRFPAPEESEHLASHGRRVRDFGGGFP